MGNSRTVTVEDGQELRQRNVTPPPGEKLAENMDEAELTADVLELARFGKKQVLRRNFGLASMIGFSCGLMSTWEGMLTVFILGYSNGGPAGLVYGLIITWAGILSVFMSMGELASMVPTAGGQYHWVNILAPDSCKKFLSYTTGWLTIAGWVAVTSAAAFFVASLTLALVAQNHPEYTIQNWHVTLLFWGVLCLSVLTNTLLSAALPLIEIFILILHIVGFFAFIIPLTYLSEHNDASEVFATWNNGGGWSNIALAFFIGLQGHANAFIGTDGAVHMSEEVQNASRNVPIAMVISTGLNGLMAFAMLLAFLFCKVDIDSALESQYPFIPILATGLGSNAGATVLTAVIILMILAAEISSMAAASRMFWAFSRDKGVPGYRHWSKINQATKVPLFAILIVTGIAALLGFINLGSATAFNDIISLTLEGLFSSYLVAIVLLLYRRLRGEIGERTEEQLWHESASESASSSRKPFTWGPWRIPGIFGVINNILSISYLVLICFFAFWPISTPPTAENMNYSQTVWGAVIIISVLYYIFFARKSYKGPLVEVQLVKQRERQDS